MTRAVAPGLSLIHLGEFLFCPTVVPQDLGEAIKRALSSPFIHIPSTLERLTDAPATLSYCNGTERYRRTWTRSAYLTCKDSNPGGENITSRTERGWARKVRDYVT